MRKIDYIMIHCTATHQNLTAQDFKKMWHIRGWKTGGYHIIIYPDGEVERCYSDIRVTNGAKGYNANSIHIAYVGGIGFNKMPYDNRTTAQTNALAQLIKHYHMLYPTAQIIGHRDIWGRSPQKWQKMCPCFDVKNFVKEISHKDITPK